MIYQLPSGKIIMISVEQYLELTEDDIEFIVSTNRGSYATSPFYGSATRRRSTKTSKDQDKSIDFTPEYEDIDNEVIDINDIIELEDLGDLYLEED